MRKFSVAILVLVVAISVFGAIDYVANDSQLAGTIVPGLQRQLDSGKLDADNNGITDEGVTVTGKYKSLYAYDAGGDWYWNLGDGREQGTVEAVDDLDQATLSTCDYQVQYRGSFENNPFLDNGWIKNDITCKGFDGTSTYNYLIVHETDRRYEGNPANAIWGTWEYHVNTQSHFGNLARPETPVGK